MPNRPYSELTKIRDAIASYLRRYGMGTGDAMARYVYETTGIKIARSTALRLARELQ